MSKKPLNLYLDAKLIEKFDKAISPYHKSNVITELISEFLKKGDLGHLQNKPSKIRHAKLSKVATPTLSVDVAHHIYKRIQELEEMIEKYREEFAEKEK